MVGTTEILVLVVDGELVEGRTVVRVTVAVGTTVDLVTVKEGEGVGLGIQWLNPAMGVRLAKKKHNPLVHLFIVLQ